MTINLDRPRDHDTHTLADFLELLCLVSLDRQVSTDTLRDYIEDNRGKHSYQLRDEHLEDVLGQVRWRVEALADWYPFTLTNHGRVVEAPDEISPNQSKYVSLLICANLPFFERNERQALTDFFERLSENVLRELWPVAGTAMTVGKNTTALTGSKAARLNTLGKLIGANPILKDTDFREGDKGDGGIDLAAYIELDRFEHQNTISALGQCACSRSEWSAKHSEITHTRLRTLLPHTALWMEMLFTPILFRENSGKWAVPGDVPAITLVDRLRLIGSLIRSEPAGHPELPDIVQTLLDFRLDVV